MMCNTIFFKARPLPISRIDIDVVDKELQRLEDLKMVTNVDYSQGLGGARLLSGGMPDSQSSEPGFESRFSTVSKIGHFRSLH